MGRSGLNAARGVLYLAIAKLYFMVAGYAIYFVLPRLFGNEVDWGNYLLVIGMVSVIDNVIVTGTIQTVSKFTAQGDASPDAVKRAGLRLQILIGGGIAALFALAAPWIAALQRDPSLTPHYRLSAGIIACYALYAVFVGSANGQRHFGQQAGLDMLFATIRAGLILAAAAAGLGVFGAVGGFVSAAFVIVVVSAMWVGLPKKCEAFPIGRLAGFAVQLFGYTFTLNLAMRVDLFLLKRHVGTLPGALASSATDAASAAAGYYGTAQSLAFIPYQAILAVAFVIFPLISRSTFSQDIETTRSYIQKTLRFSLIGVAGVATVLMANPAGLIVLPYPARYVAGAPALQILAAGMVFFSVLTIINTILNGAGHTRDSLISGLVMVVVSFAANSLLIPRAASQLGALEAAAWASAGAMLLGSIVAGALLYRRFATGIPWLTLLRVLAAAAAGITVGRFIPDVSKLLSLGEAIVVFLTFMSTLFLLGEFSKEDLAAALSPFRQK